MNKTVNINLGGLFFHIDEDAYQKLTRYFDAIKRSLSNSNGQDEIIKDIEMRIAEIITEKHSSEKQVINVKEVEDVIAIMGQPEDYRLEDDGAPTNAQTNFDSSKKTRKLYRDTDKGVFGGVCSGLSHYLGIDQVWIRIIFAVLFFGYGTGFIAYIILWIAMPAAVTTSEKLEMTGEPVNISNIEKKVREEFENVSEKIKNANYDKMGNQVKTGVEKIAGNLGDILASIFKVFAKILGALICVSSAFWLVILTLGIFTLGSSSFVDVPWQNYYDAFNYTNLPLWLVGLLVFFAFGIPFFLLFLLGLKLLSNNIKSIGSIAKYTLLAVWLIAVGILISLGIKQATEVAFDGKTVQKETIQIQPNDTLFIKFRFNDYYAKNVENHNDFLFTQDESGKDQIYSNNVRFHVLKTDEAQPYLQIEKQSSGKSLGEAKKRSEKIVYNYKIEGKNLIFDNYLLTEVANKYRQQEVEIFLYLPKGTFFKTDDSIKEFDSSVDEFFNLHFSGNYTYKVEDAKVKCLNCPKEENDYNDVEKGNDEADSTASVILNKDGVLIKTSKNEDDDADAKKIKSVKINSDGITIKTK